MHYSKTWLPILLRIILMWWWRAKFIVNRARSPPFKRWSLMSGPMFCNSTGSNDPVYAEPWTSIHLWTSVCLCVAQTKHFQRASEVKKHPTDRRPSSAWADVLAPVTGLCGQLIFKFKSSGSWINKLDFHTVLNFSNESIQRSGAKIKWLIKQIDMPIMATFQKRIIC